MQQGEWIDRTGQGREGGSGSLHGAGWISLEEEKNLCAFLYAASPLKLC